jgi:ribokinase
MKIFNFGSINIDHVYQVPHLVRPGETLGASHYQQVLGGKGANQSIALAKANCDVLHVGAIAQRDQVLLEQLDQAGVNTAHIALLTTATGHAIIQVDAQAENAIVLFPGANHGLTCEQVNQVLDDATTQDWVLLQNETNQIDTIIQAAKQRDLTLIYNPAPMNRSLVEKQLTHIDILIVNEGEAKDLAGVDQIAQAQQFLQQKYPQLTIILTLGAQGVRYLPAGHPEQNIQVSAFKVDAIDTTAAGDTFIGYCLAGFAAKLPIEQVLTQACAASAICVTRPGASSAIPDHGEVQAFLQQSGKALS